jgi:hypothetical protein
MTVKSLRTPCRSEILSNRADSFFYSLVGVSFMFLMIHSSIQFGSSPDSAFIQQPEEDRKLLSARRFDVTKSATTSWAMVMRYRRMIQQKYNFNSNNLIDPMIIYVLRVPFSYILQSNIKKNHTK